MAHDEDPVDELRSVGMTGAAAISRVAATMIRAAQDRKMRAAQDAAQQAEDGQRRYDAQAQVAERFYREAIDTDLMTTSQRVDQDALRQGSQQWAELDPDRFGPYADRLNERFEELGLEEARRGEAGREEAGREERTADEEQAKAERADNPEKAEEHRQASEGAAARTDDTGQEAGRPARPGRGQARVRGAVLRLGRTSGGDGQGDDGGGRTGVSAGGQADGGPSQRRAPEDRRAQRPGAAEDGCHRPRRRAGQEAHQDVRPR
jgi:hypothetical protein